MMALLIHNTVSPGNFLCQRACVCGGMPARQGGMLVAKHLLGIYVVYAPVPTNSGNPEEWGGGAPNATLAP